MSSRSVRYRSRVRGQAIDEIAHGHVASAAANIGQLVLLGRQDPGRSRRYLPRRKIKNQME